MTLNGPLGELVNCKHFRSMHVHYNAQHIIIIMHNAAKSKCSVCLLTVLVSMVMHQSKHDETTFIRTITHTHASVWKCQYVHIPLRVFSVTSTPN